MAGARARWPHATALAVVAVVALLSWAPRLAGPIDLRWDASAYYMLGTSLASGEGYRLLSEPGTPPSVLHPPLLPFLVAAVQGLLGTDDPAIVGNALRWIMMVVSLALALATYVFLARAVPRWLALAGALVGVVRPQYLYCSDALYAEPFFTLFAVLVLLSRDRPLPGGRAVAVLAAWLSYAARTAGIALLVAWVVDRWHRHGARAGVTTLLLALVPVLAWSMWGRAAESSPERLQPAYAYQTAPYVYFNVSYARSLLKFEDPFRPEAGPLTPGGFAKRVGANLALMPTEVGRALSSWHARRSVAWVLSGLAAIGAVLLARRREWLVLGFIGLSIAVVCVTPFPMQFSRYLLPLYPVLALALLMAVAALERGAWPPLQVMPQWLRTLLAAGCVALAAVPALTTTAALFRNHHEPVVYEGRDGRPVQYRLFRYGSFGPAYDAAVDWLGRNAAPGDVVAATDPHWVHVRTGLKAVLPPFERNGEVAQRLVDSVPVRFLLVETVSTDSELGAYHRYTAAILGGNPGLWERVWVSPDGRTAIHKRR